MDENGIEIKKNEIYELGEKGLLKIQEEANEEYRKTLSYFANAENMESPVEKSENTVSWDMLESIIFTKFINLKDSMELDKIDFEYLSRMGISLYDYIKHTFKEYSEARFFKDEYYLGHFD